MHFIVITITMAPLLSYPFPQLVMLLIFSFFQMEVAKKMEHSPHLRPSQRARSKEPDAEKDEGRYLQSKWVATNMYGVTFLWVVINEPPLC